jgi:hypothetical protein
MNETPQNEPAAPATPASGAPPADVAPEFQIRGFHTDENGGTIEITAEEADTIAARIASGQPPEEEAPPGEPAPETPKEKIRIGTREFANTEEAWAYAHELEQEKIAADAFRHGVEAASAASQGNPAPTPAPEEDFDKEFYTDPKSYLRKLRNEVETKVTTQIRTESAVAAGLEKLWGEFYNDYPDLAPAKEVVQLVLDQNPDLKSFPMNSPKVKEAMKIVAHKAREKRNAWVADLLPGRELPRTKNIASPGGTQVVTTQPRVEPALNFTQQMRTLNKKRPARAVRR